jgi:hypothetical protein
MATSLQPVKSWKKLVEVVKGRIELKNLPNPEMTQTKHISPVFEVVDISHNQYVYILQ